MLPISLTNAVELILEEECDELETFTELVNAQYGSRLEESDLAELWTEAKREIEGEGPDLLDDTR